MNDPVRPIIVDARAIAQQVFDCLGLDFAPYLLLSSDQLPRNCMVQNAWGCAGGLLDVAAESHLREQGLWHGRAPALYVDDRAFFQPAATAYRSTVLHEIGHIYTSGIDKSEPTPAVREFAMRCTEAAAEYNSNSVGPPWGGGHGAEWIRRTMHLKYKLMRAGFDTSFDAVATNDYGLGPPGAYWSALMPELERMLNASV